MEQNLQIMFFRVVHKMTVVESTIKLKKINKIIYFLNFFNFIIFLIIKCYTEKKLKNTK